MRKNDSLTRCIGVFQSNSYVCPPCPSSSLRSSPPSPSLQWTWWWRPRLSSAAKRPILMSLPPLPFPWSASPTWVSWTCSNHTGILGPIWLMWAMSWPGRTCSAANVIWAWEGPREAPAWHWMPWHLWIKVWLSCPLGSYSLYDEFGIELYDLLLQIEDQTSGQPLLQRARVGARRRCRSCT
jgi:hypothetical protein